MEETLLALGGAGFADPDARALDEFALGLTGAPRPRVCLLPTACGDATAYIAAFYRSFGQHAHCSHLSLFQREPGDMRALLLEQDVLYVGGGSTANLLALWRLHGVDAIVREAYAQGILLVGVSAGACALFEAGVSASFGKLAPLNDGLGLVAGGFAPHYGERREILLGMVAGGLPRGFGAGEEAGLLFRGGELSEAVATRAGGRAARLDAGPVEIELGARVLG
ncbi:MAG TPA: peptidase E [Solirubrobacteraceae bacterium]|nr:peptidase E [Solirubrobacteraceae bacterium]